MSGKKGLGAREGLDRPFARETRILALLLRFGLDFQAISRRSGIPLETVRYLYKERILGGRMRLQRTLIRERLGLSHIQFIVQADPLLEPLLYDRKLFSSAWEDVYISSLYRMIPDKLYFLDHLAPTEMHAKLSRFYKQLEGIGALKVRGVYRCTHPVYPRMRVEEYDWEMPGWDFDWSGNQSAPAETAGVKERYRRVEFDKTDLMLLNALQFNYDQSVAEIAPKYSIDPSSASWHLREHVLARGLLGEYLINWLGTGRVTRESASGTRPQTHQSAAATSFIARDLSPTEMMEVRARMRSVPYLWMERVGDTDYYSEILVPLRSLNDAFGFFSGVLRPLGDRARIFMTDQAGSMGCTVNPQLFDEESGEWMYKGDSVVEEVRKALGGSAPSAARRSRTRRARTA